MRSVGGARGRGFIYCSSRAQRWRINRRLHRQNRNKVKKRGRNSDGDRDGVGIDCIDKDQELYCEEVCTAARTVNCSYS